MNKPFKTPWQLIHAYNHYDEPFNTLDLPAELAKVDFVQQELEPVDLLEYYGGDMAIHMMWAEPFMFYWTIDPD